MLKPVYIGDTLTDTCMITDITSNSKYDIVTSLHSLTNQKGETVYSAMKGSMFERGSVINCDSEEMLSDGLSATVSFMRLFMLGMCVVPKQISIVILYCIVLYLLY